MCSSLILFRLILLSLWFTLSSASPVAAVNHRMIKSLKNITTLSNIDHLNVDSILYQLQQRNGHYKDQNVLWTPSKKFMIDLFKDLRKEESLQNSSGQLRKSKIRPSDTVRSYSAKGKQSATSLSQKY